MIEPLEYRRLLAALTIAGSAKSDALGITQSGSTVTVSNTGKTSITVNGAALAKGKSKDFTSITAISANLGAGNDSLIAADSLKVKMTVLGGAGNDTIRGSAAADSLAGEDGNDSLKSQNGNDKINGGAGNDFLDGGHDNDTISGDASSTVGGSDTIYGGLDHDSISGGPGGDALYGDDNDSDYAEDGNDTIRGGDATDYINGNGGLDSCFGDAGDDIIATVDGFPDSIDGGAGTDRCESNTVDGDVKTPATEISTAGLFVQNIHGFVAPFMGTSGNDVIVVNCTETTINITLNGLTISQSVQAILDDIALRNSFDTGLQAIVILAEGGDDVITVKGTSPIAFGSEVVIEVAGGDGDDSIVGGATGEFLSGSAGDDTVKGNAGDDSVYGGHGSDLLDAGDGDDCVEGDDHFPDEDSLHDNYQEPGDDGSDTIYGGLGGDLINGDGGGDVIYGDDNDGDLDEDGSDGISGGGGGDYINGNGAADSVSGDGGDDIIGNVDGSVDLLDGGDGNDRSEQLFKDNDLDNNSSIEVQAAFLSVQNINGPVGIFIDGTDGADTITVQASDDEIIANVNGLEISQSVEAPEDLLNELQDGLGVRLIVIVRAGDGDDKVLFTGDSPIDLMALGEEGADSIIGGIADEEFYGGLGNDTIFGRSGHDFISGGDDVDQIFGENGNDTIEGDGGNTYFDTFSNAALNTADTIDGGAGIDVASYALLGFNVIADVTNGMQGEGDVLISIAGVRGGSGNDSLTGDGGANILDGGIGGDDVLVGLAGDDTFIAFSGNDSFDGGGNSDTADFSAYGIDLNLSLDGVINDGPVDASELYTLTSIENLGGGQANDSITGDNGGNSLRGGAGNDTLKSLGGQDFLFPGAGIDIVSGGDGVDVLDCSDETGDQKISLDSKANDGVVGALTENFSSTLENIIGGSGDDLLSGNSSPQTIVGNAGNDTLAGGDGVDCLSGSDGNDSLRGGKGNDILHGRTGNDTIRGEAGKDQLFGEEGNDLFINLDGEIDTITGGSGSDTADRAKADKDKFNDLIETLLV